MYNYESRGGSSDFWLQASNFRLNTSCFKLQTSDLTKCELRISDFWPLILKAEWPDLRTSHFPLPTSHFPLPTSDFRLLTSNFRFPTSDFQLPTSDFQLLSSNFRLLTSLSVLLGSIAARSITRVLMPKVKAQLERTAVLFSPQKRTTTLALEKATKHKANPATDEVRLENRNHGLAWSHSGNNKTVQTLLILFYPA